VTSIDQAARARRLERLARVLARPVCRGGLTFFVHRAAFLPSPASILSVVGKAE